ncbi:MAG: asparagine synthase-related protein [Alphaproteobacteria bacterium]
MAGLFSRRGGVKPSPEICADIRSLLSRHPGDKVVEFADERLWLAKIDIGAFGASGFYRDGDGSVAMLTGEPLLGDGDGDRYRDLIRLHADWKAGEWRLAARTRGVFTAASYAPAQSRLTIVTDRLGLRGLYLLVTDEFVLFATAFRIIEALHRVHKTPDLQAVAEQCTYGVPLGDRTSFLEVKRLLPGEAAIIDGNSVRRFCYWRWDTLQPVSSNGLAQRLYDEFLRAVTLRLKSDRTAQSFLSGGLDSRTIVAALVDKGIATRTVIFGDKRSQDRVLGRGFAEALGTPSIELDIDPSWDGQWWRLARNAAAAFRREAVPAAPLERPGVIWNGEGGSVCFGHVHLTQEIVDLARNGGTAFFREFAKYNLWESSWRRVMRQRWSDELEARVQQLYRDEMARSIPADPGRVPFLFLIFNDQRRKLEGLQANADLVRAEMLMPFFDMEFLSLIAAAEIDLFIGHRIYMDFLHLFQPPVYSTPWQAYPGHLPCPIPVPADLDYQWTRKSGVPPDAKRLARRMLRQSLRPFAFPGWLLRRDIVFAAAIATLLGIGNYDYLLRPAELFGKVIGLGQPLRSSGSRTQADRPSGPESRPLGVISPSRLA